jgi:hypothetical protein
MKTILIKGFFLLCVILLVSKITLAQGKIFFDVKTKLFEKPKLTHIKTATDWLLLQTDWGSVSEFTADYQLWIKKYKKSAEGNHVTVSLVIELRTVELLSEGDLIKKQPIDISYFLESDNKRANTQWEFYKKKFSAFSEQIKIEAFEAGQKIVAELFKMVSEAERNE